MNKTNKTELLKRFLFNKTHKRHHYLCNAPFVSISINISGLVSPCCFTYMQNKKADYFSQKSLSEIWNGDIFNYYRACFEKDAYPIECEICKNTVEAGNFEIVKSRIYDNYIPHPHFPRLMEITLDNTCNLQCIMCNSTLSSQIAKKNGVLNNNKYDTSALLDDFEKFIPHLDEVVFSGGEPFLSLPGKKLMHAIIDRNPRCLINVNTNGTILTNEIKEMMKIGNFNFNLSLDSINKTTFEKIRIGAKFETVINNLNFFADYSRRKGRNLFVPVCPLQLNYKELPEIVTFCNNNNFNIIFVHVIKAHDASLSTASPELLREAIQVYNTYAFYENNLVQKNNAEQFKGLIRNVMNWLIFAEKKAEFIKKLIPDTDKFKQSDTATEKRIKDYIADQDCKDSKTSDRFEIWKIKKDELFKTLPAYFMNEIFHSHFFSLSDDKLLYYIENFPLTDLTEHFLSLENEIIKKNC